jgi:phosphoglycerate dehydrogenase-like enzyme
MPFLTAFSDWHAPKTVAHVAQALGMNIIVYTSRPRLTAASRKDPNYHQAGMGDPDGTIPSAWFHGRMKEDLHRFLSHGADFLVLSLPLTIETRHIIGEEELRIMNAKIPAFLVNIARGPLLDHAALLESLKDGPKNGGLLGAALDVMEPESLPADSELWTLPNVFISPHASAMTPGTIDQSFRILEENLARRAKGEKLLNVVQVRDDH